jgi:hypothetical protein
MPNSQQDVEAAEASKRCASAQRRTALRHCFDGDEAEASARVRAWLRCAALRRSKEAPCWRPCFDLKHESDVRASACGGEGRASRQKTAACAALVDMRLRAACVRAGSARGALASLRRCVHPCLARYCRRKACALTARSRLHSPSPATLLARAVSRIALVKPDKARGVENMIISMAQRGQISEPVRAPLPTRAACLRVTAGVVSSSRGFALTHPVCRR